MKNKLFNLIFIIFTFIILTGCGNDVVPEDDKQEQKPMIKGNCTAVECIKKINLENTLNEINNIIGFEGTLIEDNIYYWELSENTGVKVAYDFNGISTIGIDYVKKDLANDKVDFSRYSELKPKVSEGINYNDLISYIGGVEGTIIEKSSSSTRYIWVSPDGSYFSATFSNLSGKCTFATVYIK